MNIKLENTTDLFHSSKSIQSVNNSRKALKINLERPRFIIQNVLKKINFDGKYFLDASRQF